MSKSFGWLLVCVCLLFTSSGWAAARGLVIVAEGANAEVLRRNLAAAVPSGLPVQDPAALARAIEAQGVKGSLADALANPRTRKRALQAVKNALSRSEAEAVISARAKRARGGAEEVRLVLVVRAQTEPVVEEVVTVTKDDQGKSAFGPLLAGPLQELAAAAPQQAPAAAEPPAASASSATTKTGAAATSTSTAETEAPQATNTAAELASGDNAGIDRVRRPVDFATGMVMVEAGAGVGRRSFQYNDPARGALRNYLAPGVGMWVLAGQLYPFANSGIPIVKDLGATGNVAGALPFTSKTSDGRSSADGAWTKYAAGAHLRIRTSSRPNPTLLGLEVLYGGSHFSFSGSDAAGIALANEIPSVNYKYVRGGADVRLPLGATPISVQAAAGFMRVLSAGTFSDRFPHASINGVDARIAAAFAFAPWLEAKVSGEYTRVFSSIKPQLQDPGDIAGGSLDQFLVLNVGVSAIF